MEGGCPITFITCVFSFVSYLWIRKRSDHSLRNGMLILRVRRSTNTLGSCLFLSGPGKHGKFEPSLESIDGEGIGGMAGAALHPLALGNVATLRRMLQEDSDLKYIKMIGVGGVDDGPSFERMMAAGADAVAVGTGLGREGLDVFEKIAKSAEKSAWNSPER
jgi:dihydroorotate dehydrogenase (fumarate)